MSEFRITYTIERRSGDGAFKEIGFGSSGTCDGLDQAAHLVASAVSNREWETDGDMPDPDEV